MEGLANKSYKTNKNVISLKFSGVQMLQHMACIKEGGHVHFHDNFFLSMDSISNIVNVNVI